MLLFVRTCCFGQQEHPQVLAMIRSVSLALLGLFLFSTLAWGQNDPPPMPENGEAKKPTELREQSIYIPYSRLKGIFEKEGRGVFIPYEKF